jgi:cardiolipin synthase
MLNLPNFLTLLRLVAIPIFLILLGDHEYEKALIVFVAAGITDAVDGALARLLHAKTTLGAYLDPAADKLLLLTAFITLTVMNELPRWLTVVVVSRDVIVVLGYFLLFTMTQETMEVRPTVLGKASTFFQLLVVTLALTTLVWEGWVPASVEHTASIIAALTTTAAGAQYVHRGLRWVQHRDDESTGTTSRSG